MCMCNVYSNEESRNLSAGGYYCPQCYNQYSELPVICRAFGSRLVSAPHLTRPYQNLFLTGKYSKINFENQEQMCFACQKIFGEKNYKF